MISDREQMKKRLCAQVRQRILGGMASEQEEGLEQLDDLLWEVLRLYQGAEYRTAKGLNFTYSVKGYEMFVSRKDKSLTRATVTLAFHTALSLQSQGLAVSGPKKLKTFGASYLFPVFIDLGIINIGEDLESIGGF